MHTYHGTREIHMEIRGQLVWIGFLLLPCGSQGIKLRSSSRYLYFLSHLISFQPDTILCLDNEVFGGTIEETGP